MISKELIAASSESLVLSILERSENYGYEIIRLVRDSSKERIQWSDGMLYPVLHRLEKRGLIQSPGAPPSQDVGASTIASNPGATGR